MTNRDENVTIPLAVTNFLVAVARLSFNLQILTVLLL